MQVINCECATAGLVKAVDLLLNEGTQQNSRNGLTLEIPEPVAVVFENPSRHVLHLQGRNENPFFHWVDAIHMLCGRNDVEFLTYFNPRMREWSDNGLTFNAPYGYRLRRQWGDQIANVVKALKADPNTRQAVLQIWNPDDLLKTTKDKACNMQVVFRLRGVHAHQELDMTVYNRSNDAIWGLFGSNVVQFSMLHELVYNTIRWEISPAITMGEYTHVTNSLHAYIDTAPWKRTREAAEHWVSDHCQTDICSQQQTIHVEPFSLGIIRSSYHPEQILELNINLTGYNEYFYYLVKAWWYIKKGRKLDAANEISKSPFDPAWKMAFHNYIERAIKE